MPDPQPACPACKIPIDQQFRAARKTLHKLTKSKAFKALPAGKQGVLWYEVIAAQKRAKEAYSVAIDSIVSSLDSA